MLENFSPEVVYYVRKKCDTSWKLVKNRIRICDLTFILEGHATYCIDGVTYTLKQGDAVFIHSGSLREAGEADMVCAAFNFQYTDSETLTLPPVICWKKNSGIYTLLEAYQKEQALQNLCWERKCCALFTEIICELIRCTSCILYSPLVRKMEDFILTHLFEPMTVREIAESVGRHPNYCGMLFHREKDCTLQEYIHRLRLDHAANLMRDDSLSIGEIALQSGYQDIYYFSRIFKRYKGVSPSTYAASLKK